MNLRPAWATLASNLQTKTPVCMHQWRGSACTPQFPRWIVAFRCSWSNSHHCMHGIQNCLRIFSLKDKLHFGNQEKAVPPNRECSPQAQSSAKASRVLRKQQSPTWSSTTMSKWLTLVWHISLPHDHLSLPGLQNVHGRPPERTPRHGIPPAFLEIQSQLLRHHTFVEV